MFSFNNFPYHKRGFIALLTTIIISFVLLTIVVAVSFMGFFGRFNILGSEAKERSSALAEACIQTAILKFSQDNSYNGNDWIFVNNTSCFICSGISAVSGGNRIRVQASSSDAYTNLEVIVTSLGAIRSWEEKENFTGSTCTAT